MRDATAGIWTNSVFYDYANKALQVEDLPSGSGTDSYDRLLNGEIRFLNNVFYKFGNYTTFDANPITGIIAYTPGGDDTTCQALIDSLLANNNVMQEPQLRSVSRRPDGQLDPRPAPGSPLLSNAASYPNDSFFTPVNYKGAFDTANLWISYWTALASYGYIPSQFVLSARQPTTDLSNELIISIQGNQMTIRSTQAPMELVELYSLSGELIYQGKTGNAYQTTVQVNPMSGLMLLRVYTAQSLITRKILLTKE